MDNHIHNQKYKQCKKKVLDVFLCGQVTSLFYFNSVAIIPTIPFFLVSFQVGLCLTLLSVHEILSFLHPEGCAQSLRGEGFNLQYILLMWAPRKRKPQLPDYWIKIILFVFAFLKKTRL